MYQNQFQKYEPEPFVEKDIEPHVISEDGPVMSATVCRAAMQRSIGKLCFNAGFEEFQPTALDAMTDLAMDYFGKLARSLSVYMQKPKEEVVSTVPGSEAKIEYRPKYSMEEAILHSLQDNGVDLESLDSYVKDDFDRLSTKLSNLHDRMKSHLADLLRPAFAADGSEASTAFNDGSEQFVGGNFADEVNEDFFGFKELGLDVEFGLSSLSVPLHLLQNRMHNAYQAQNTRFVPFLSFIPIHSLTFGVPQRNCSDFPNPSPATPIPPCHHRLNQPRNRHHPQFLPRQITC
jgi:transcriptional activator SPT7